MAKSVKLKPTNAAPKPIAEKSPKTAAPASLATQAPPQPASSRNVFTDVIYSIIEPGVNRGLLLALHFAFIISIGSLLCLVYLTEMRETAPWVLLISNTILYPTIIWFISRLQFTADPTTETKNKQD